MHGLVLFRQINYLFANNANDNNANHFLLLFTAAMLVLASFKKIFVSKVPQGGELQVECTYPSSCRTGTKPSVWMTHWPADCCSFCVSLLSEMPCSRRSSPKFPAMAWWP